MKVSDEENRVKEEGRNERLEDGEKGARERRKKGIRKCVGERERLGWR